MPYCRIPQPQRCSLSALSLDKLRHLKALLENPLPSTWHVFQGHSKSEIWVCKSLQNDSRLVAITLFAQGRHNFITMLGVFKVKKEPWEGSPWFPPNLSVWRSLKTLKAYRFLLRVKQATPKPIKVSTADYKSSGRIELERCPHSLECLMFLQRIQGLLPATTTGISSWGPNALWSLRVFTYIWYT